MVSTTAQQKRKNMKITKTSHPQLVALMQRTYPDYKGRKFYIEVQANEFSTISYWDGGSKDYFKFVRADGKMLQVDSNTHPSLQYKENRTTKLCPGLACVRHSFFCGHDSGLTLMLCPEDMPKAIVLNDERNEKDMPKQTEKIN